MTSLLKETHVWNKALCLYFSFLCFPGGKWQMSGSRVGLSAPPKPCCYILEVLPRSSGETSTETLCRDTLARYGYRDPSTESCRDTSACLGL